MTVMTVRPRLIAPNDPRPVCLIVKESSQVLGVTPRDTLMGAPSKDTHTVLPSWESADASSLSGLVAWL